MEESHTLSRRDRSKEPISSSCWSSSCPLINKSINEGKTECRLHLSCTLSIRYSIHERNCLRVSNDIRMLALAGSMASEGESGNSGNLQASFQTALPTIFERNGHRTNRSRCFKKSHPAQTFKEELKLLHEESREASPSTSEMLHERKTTANTHDHALAPGSAEDRRSIRCRCGGPAFFHPPRTPASKADASIYPSPSLRSALMAASTIFRAISSCSRKEHRHTIRKR